MPRLTACLAFSLCTLVASLLPAEGFSRLLPDDTVLYIECRDLPKTLNRYAASPLWHSLREFEWQNSILFLSQVATKAGNSHPFSREDLTSYTTELGGRLKSLTSHISGDVAFAVGGFERVLEVFETTRELRAKSVVEDGVEELEARETASVMGTLSLLIKVSDGEALEAELVDLTSDSLMSQEDLPLGYLRDVVNGTPIHALRPSPAKAVSDLGLYWFIQDGVWAIAFTEFRIRQLAEFQKAPPASSLATSPSFLESMVPYHDADSFTFLDPAFLDRFLRHVAEDAEVLPDNGNASLEAILDWLALDALIPITQGSTLEDGGIRVTSQLGFSRETALSRLLFDPEVSELPSPSFIHTDMPQITIANWHIGRFWTRLEKGIGQISPQAAAGLGMVRMLAAGQLGFDIKLQFFDHLDSGLVVVQAIAPEVLQELQAAMASGDASRLLEVNSRYPTNGQNYLIGFELKNEAAIRDSIDRLMMRFHPQGAPDPVTLGGVELMMPHPPGMDGGLFDDFITLAFVDGWLLVNLGTPTLLENAIAAAGNDALQIWQDAEFTSLRARLPADVTSLQFMDAKQQEDALIMMQSSLRFLAENPDTPLPDFKPLVNFMSRMLQTTTREGLTVTTESFTEFRQTP